MVGHKKVDKWCGHAGNICFTEKLPDHLFNDMMRILLMNDNVLTMRCFPILNDAIFSRCF